MSEPRTPYDPRADRQGALVACLRGAGVACFVLATAALAPGEVGRVSRGAMLGLLVAVPVTRSLWLAARWIRKGDVRYGLVAIAAATIVAAAPLLA